jgi:hypothetical protein
MATTCRMDCRREADGFWRIAWFGGTPVFVGNDPFVKQVAAQELKLAIADSDSWAARHRPVLGQFAAKSWP